MVRRLDRLVARLRRFLLLAAALGAASRDAGSLAAQDPPALDGPAPVVVAVTSSRPEAPDQAGLGDRITLRVENLDTLLSRSGGACRNVVLFLDDMSLPGLEPESCDVATSTVRFLLRRHDDGETSEANKAACDRVWHALLGRPSGYTKPVVATVGWTEHFDVRSTAPEFRLVVVRHGGFLAFAIFALTLLGVLLYFAARSDIIRNPMGDPPAGGKPCRYSLSRFQMAFWTALVLLAFLFVWLVTGELDSITESVLALMGIGAGTALGAALVESPKAGSEPGPALPSRGFLYDVLSDGEGLILHRFQLFVWTLVLGFIFVTSVYRDLWMPDFSTTLLGLMGISSGTYLGFKLPAARGDGANPPS